MFFRSKKYSTLIKKIILVYSPEQYRCSKELLFSRKITRIKIIN